MKSIPRAVPQKSVPHQFLSGWEIFFQKWLAEKNTLIRKSKYDRENLKYNHLWVENLGFCNKQKLDIQIN